MASTSMSGEYVGRNSRLASLSLQLALCKDVEMGLVTGTDARGNRGAGIDDAR